MKSFGRLIFGNRLRASSVIFLILLAVIAVVVLVAKVGVASPGSQDHVNSEDGWILGNPNAPVTIVEFSDFQCPFCKDTALTLSRLVEDYPSLVRIIFRHFPLPQHSLSLQAAVAAEAAGDQGKFWEMHDKLFENQNNLTISDFQKFADELGLDMQKFNQSLDSSEFIDKVLRDRSSGISLGVHAVPTLYLNGQELPGPYTYDSLKEHIEKELAKK